MHFNLTQQNTPLNITDSKQNGTGECELVHLFSELYEIIVFEKNRYRNRLKVLF